eukprot:TRINITY_DN13302_c0_g1_i2.p2 TRINITY_DN13302_c0_g1~~TRINITY_DN13302_c0_g1_i2.p2  ORF type:complete len:107 (+),score=12.48 TRINITY_DN13302_c0_g1_i2:2-322(+)
MHMSAVQNVYTVIAGVLAADLAFLSLVLRDRKLAGMRHVQAALVVPVLMMVWVVMATEPQQGSHIGLKFLPTFVLDCVYQQLVAAHASDAATALCSPCICTRGVFC